MASANLIRLVPGGWHRRGLLALLLVGTMLLCHGAYGALHQVCATLHAEHSSLADTHGTGAGEHPVEHQGADGEGQHLGHIAYAATILVLSLGAFLWLLSGARRWTTVAPSSLPDRVFPPVFLRPPRRPEPSFLQVFRL